LTEELLQKKKKFTALLAFDDLTARGRRPRAGQGWHKRCLEQWLGDWFLDDIAIAGLSVPSCDYRAANRSRQWWPQQ